MVATLQFSSFLSGSAPSLGLPGWWGRLCAALPSGSAGARGTVGDAYHRPILVQEVLEVFAPAGTRVIFDGTLGGGGHSEALLEAGASVIGGDQDPAALAFATTRLAGFGERFRTVRGNFSDLETLLEEPVDGIFVDIGVSSRQLEDASRGFSFMRDGLLDMRMDPDGTVTAASILAEESPEALAKLFFELGEERASRRIAEAICEARERAPIETTAQLAAIVESVVPRTSGKHPATKVFQALRIAVNDELGVLEQLLNKAVHFLKPGGVLAVMSFHSLEDRMVKRFFRAHSQPMMDRPEWPAPRPNPDYLFDLPSRNQAITASPAEIADNPRARSARLRAAIRV